MQKTGVRWPAMPLVRLVLPVMVGIAGYRLQSEADVMTYLVLGLLLAVGVYSSYRHPSIRGVRLWGWGLQLLLVGIGWCLCYVQDGRRVPHLAQADTTPQCYWVTLATPPKLAGSTLRIQGQLTHRQQDGQAVPCAGKVLLSVALDTQSVALQYGDQLLVQAKLRPIDAPQNPYAFDARAYYAQQHIYHRAHLASGTWKRMAWAGSSWQQAIYALRAHLLSVLGEHLTTPHEYAVGAALLLGAKEALDRDLRDAYADTGAMHLLAVSGLHVGILMALWAWGLRGLERSSKKGRAVRALVLLLILWTYALLTGASASVLRASTMFSFVLVGQLWDKRINSYNALAASALLLLAIDPFMLWDIGFQLSYMALLGILYFHPKIYAWWEAPSKPLDWLWSGMAVSLAAQLGTAPLSLFYFHQFPLYFWLSGVVVMAFAGLLLSVGMALLVVHPIPILGMAVGKLLHGLLWLTNSLIFGVQQLPGAVSEGWWWTGWQMILAYGILWTAYWTFRQRQLRWAVLPCLGLLAWINWSNYRLGAQLQQQQLCLHYHRTGGFLSWIEGQTCTTIGDSSLTHPHTRQYAQQNYLYAQGIRHTQFHGWEDTVRYSTLAYTSYRAQLGAHRLAVVQPQHLREASLAPLAVDYLWIQHNPKLYDLSDLDDLYAYKHLIFDASNPAYRRAAWAVACEERGIAYTDLAEEGALLIE